MREVLFGIEGDTATWQAQVTETASVLPQGLEERMLEIPTTTNNTLELLRQRGNACSVPPELQISSFSTAAAHLQSSEPLCPLDVTTRTARLQSSRSPYLDVPTPAAHLQSSRALEANSYTSLHPEYASRAPEFLRQTPPRLRACSASPELLPSMRPTRPYTRSTPPELQISIPLHLHIYTPAAHLQIS